VTLELIIFPFSDKNIPIFEGEGSLLRVSTRLKQKRNSEKAKKLKK
jgi:hypothetical protein